MNKRLMLALLAFLAVLPVTGRAQEVDEDATAPIQGRWELPKKFPDGSVGKIEKEVFGSIETVRIFGPDGRILQAHQVEFTVHTLEGHSVFVWKNGAIIDGPLKGRAMNDGRFAFSVKGDQWICVHGLAKDDMRPVFLEVWTRIPVAAPKDKKQP